MEERADRLHAAISATFEGYYGVLEDAEFERRLGHARLLFPAVPHRLFNGVLIESSPAARIVESIGEVEARGLLCGVQLRKGANPDIVGEVTRLGFTERMQMPGMTATPAEFADVSVSGLEIVHVQDEAGLAAAARVAGGHDGRMDITRELFAPGFSSNQRCAYMSASSKGRA